MFPPLPAAATQGRKQPSWQQFASPYSNEFLRGAGSPTRPWALPGLHCKAAPPAAALCSPQRGRASRGGPQVPTGSTGHRSSQNRLHRRVEGINPNPHRGISRGFIGFPRVLLYSTGFHSTPWDWLAARLAGWLARRLSPVPAKRRPCCIRGIVQMAESGLVPKGLVIADPRFSRNPRSVFHVPVHRLCCRVCCVKSADP